MKCLKKQHGFLMIEVLLATVVITIALVAVAGMFVQSTQANISAADYTTATAIAQDYLERIKAGILTSPYTTETVTRNNVTYSVVPQETVSPLDSGNRLYTETVTITWTERGQSMTMQMTTYIVKNLSQFP